LHSHILTMNDTESPCGNFVRSAKAASAHYWLEYFC